jgi:glutamate-1-semialdehyde 2,1-aminomutase
MTGVTDAATRNTTTQKWFDAVVEQFRQRTPRSLAAFEEAKRIIPGGVPAGLGFMSPYPLYVDRAGGAYVWDADGHKMLDFMAGDWLLPLGHCNPAVVAATTAQIANGTTFCSPHTTLGTQLATLLQERIPSMERIRFTTSGTEATATALRLARGFTGRGKVAKMRGGYHGTHDVSLIANGRFLNNPDYVSPGIIPGTQNSVVLLPFNDPDGCEALIEQHASDLAAVIVEPIIGGSGMVPGTSDFLHRLREVTSRHGVVLIFDETVTFATGPHGVQGEHGIRPDLTTLGKAIGGGLPLGAFGGRADIMELVDPVIDPTTAYRHASTLGGTPAPLAAGLAQVQQLTPAAHEHMNALGERLRAGVRDIASRLDVPLQATGAAHIFGLHWTRTPVVDFETTQTSDRMLISQLMLSMYNQGYLFFRAGTGTVTAPMTVQEIDGMLAALETSIRDGGFAG